MRRQIPLLALALPILGGATVHAANLAALPGVVAVAESQHRDRWGVDGWHPWLAVDGKTDTAWLSDNWEYSHTLALIFPRQATVRQVVVRWNGAKPPLTLVVRRWQDGKWADLKTVQPPADATEVTVDLDPVAVSALAVTQPAGQAPPEADRRLRIAELEVNGDPVEPAAAVNVAALKTVVSAQLAAARQVQADARVAPQIAVVMSKPKPAGFMGIINREDLKRGRQNLSRPWARKIADAALRDADWWVGQSDDAIRGFVPAENPRAISVSFEKGCPLHGGARGVFSATLEKPYVWKCSKGGEEWSDGAVIKNPKTGADVTVHDDGNGWLAPDGFLTNRRYYFVAAYRYFLLGKLFSGPYEPDGGSVYRGGTPVMQLAMAYAFTGDAKYAHKCGVMLTRLADVYRFYDGGIEGPSQRQDGYIGNTFERFLVQNVIQACDMVWDELSPEQRANIQRNLLGYIYEYLHRCMPYFDGDFIMYEMTALAALAATLGNEEIIRETLESDVGLRVLLTNSWFRDGKFIYDSTGYNLGNALTPLTIAEWLHGVPYQGKPLDLYNDPDTRMSMLFDFIRDVDCDGRVPQIGDTGGSRSRTLRDGPAYSMTDERALLRLPSQRDYYLNKILAAGNGDIESLRESAADSWLAFHAEPPLPPVPASQLKPVIPHSTMFDDGGIAILRAGSKAATRLHVPITFSKGSYAHGHPDKLALNVFRYGWDLSADMGYPTTWTGAKNGGWETNTASHSTVMVDEQGQRGYVIGNLHFFATEPLCDVVEADALKVYPQCSMYQRTVGVVRDEQGEPLYAVDFFRVAGGKTRDYHFHSLGKPEDLTIVQGGVPGQGPGGDPAALKWTKQEQGSLAGAEVPPMSKPGTSWLWDVQRASGERPIVAQWSPTTGTSQGDHYLLTKQSFTNCTVEFKLTRTGQASGPQERCVFVFATSPAQVNSRRVIMMPADTFPVGKAVPVKIVVQGAQATMTINGQPAGRVDVSGSPAEAGSVGLLHYYNYAWDYSDFSITPEGGQPIKADFSQPLSDDFWGRNDGTYTASGGVLQVRDSEPLRMIMHTPGAPGRELIRATAEGYGVQGQAPLEGHVILRDRPADPQAISVFAAVFEPINHPPAVRSVTELPVTAPEAKPGEVTALLIESEGPSGLRRDVVLSSASADEFAERRIKLGDATIIFTGRFAVLRSAGGKFTSGMLVGGGDLAATNFSVENPGTYRGAITAVNVGAAAIAVKTAAGSPSPGPKIAGRKLLVRNPAYGYTSVYTVEKVETLQGGSYRFTLSMPLVVARGTIKDVDAAQASFASQTPVMKLRVNAGLFDGKPVRTTPAGQEWRLKSATEEAFVLQDAKGLTEFPKGGSYVVCDIGVGDQVEVAMSGSWSQR